MLVKPHVLLVDDEVLAIMALEQELLQGGFRVTTALNGKKALEHWRHDHFDVLVKDLRMPLMSGNDLIQQLRSDYPKLPVVVISGYITAEISGELNKMFGRPLVIMAKPVRLEDIIQALKKLLTETGQ
ncbi:response regulator (plasmid) [Skermanella sp. TT6]|uniref:Response regulator n=1 Tax=Skermanella cutis TaxID=2775420 RepID=A0ABX7BF21_9PROT|nr:response regulator [Skermanella sp. TT6]QQP92678.1 response regulator [Skermanella sp. TT6]